MSRPRGEAGFATVVFLALLALVALFSLALADAANVVLARTRARTAADASALAAAAAQWPFTEPAGAPDEVAAATAASNGATLEGCACPVRGTAATVTVSVRTRVRILRVAPERVRASASAALHPERMFRGG